MTLLQEGEDDEDITPLDTNNVSHMDIQGPITRASARRLHQDVSSFLCFLVNMRILCYLMTLLYLGIMDRTMKCLKEYLEEVKIRWGVQVKPESHNIPSSSLPQSLGAACTKINTQVIYVVQV